MVRILGNQNIHCKIAVQLNDRKKEKRRKEMKEKRTLKLAFPIKITLDIS